MGFAYPHGYEAHRTYKVELKREEEEEEDGRRERHWKS